MFRVKKKKRVEKVQAEKVREDVGFGRYQVLASGQRSVTGDRSEMCSGAMNNNQRLAALQMLRNLRDADE